MVTKLGNIMKYMGYFSVAVVALGLVEILLGYGIAYTNMSFFGHLKGMLSLQGADTIMVGIWLILLAPVTGIFVIFFDGLRRRDLRMIVLCVLIVLLLGLTLFIKN